MKRNFVLLATMAVASLMVSCQKEEGTQNTQKLITRTVTLEEGEWQEDATRTIYEPGAGVKFTGNEVLSVFYEDSNVALDNNKQRVKHKIAPKSKDGQNIKKNQNGSYALVHPEIKGCTAYNYYFILNGCQSNSGSNGNMIVADIRPFQQPALTSFDETYDVLIGKPLMAQSAMAGNVTVNQFRRVSNLLKVEMSDSKNALKQEKVILATLKIDQSKFSQNALAGSAYINMTSDDFAAADFSSIGSGTWSNTITAYYPGGADVKDVWYTTYMKEIHPSTQADAKGLTLMVTTPTRTITRTAAAPAHKIVLEKGKMNRIGFDLSGEGVTETPSVYQSFAELDAAAASMKLTASDGKAHTWETTGAVKLDDGRNTVYSNRTAQIFPTGLILPANGKLTYPKDIIPAGKQISKVRIYLHPRDNAKEITNKTADKAVIELTANSKVADWNVSYTAKNRLIIVGIAFEFAPAA